MRRIVANSLDVVHGNLLGAGHAMAPAPGSKTALFRAPRLNKFLKPRPQFGGGRETTPQPDLA